MSNDNGSSAVILMAFVLGAIAGAATALLWAPQTGEETRRLLADKARESAREGRRGGPEQPRVRRPPA